MVRKFFNFSYSTKINKSLCNRYLIMLNKGVYLFDIKSGNFIKKYQLSNPFNLYFVKERPNLVIITTDFNDILVIDLNDFNYEKRIAIKERGVEFNCPSICISSNPDIFYCLCNFNSNKTTFGISYNYCKILK